MPFLGLKIQQFSWERFLRPLAIGAIGVLGGRFWPPGTPLPHYQYPGLPSVMTHMEGHILIGPRANKGSTIDDQTRPRLSDGQNYTFKPDNGQARRLLEYVKHHGSL